MQRPKRNITVVELTKVKVKKKGDGGNGSE